MEKWSAVRSFDDRPVWFHFTGIALDYWNEAFFKKPGSKIGDLVLVDEGTLLRTRVDSARLLLLISLTKALPKAIKELDIPIGGCPSMADKTQSQNQVDRRSEVVLEILSNHSLGKRSLESREPNQKETRRVEKEWLESHWQKVKERMKKHGMTTRSAIGGNMRKTSRDRGLRIELENETNEVWNLDMEVAKAVEKAISRRQSLKGKKRGEIKSFMQRHKPVLAFIQESKLKAFDSSVIRNLGGTWLTRGVGVNSEGAAGGILTLWKEDSFVDKECISSRSCIILAGEMVCFLRRWRYAIFMLRLLQKIDMSCGISSWKRKDRFRFLG
ncbi:hypothetical protein Dsin_014237 [Dipteronia sinensis]|uniref:DUF4283 domain-containing protein n=1 Tax=Dipteronia sinensis TaxID=43782 RepID=A0AAE0EA48_9ROSI|nr:hypothetical protein Dsin_014237 [Dipteronia sinensis]